jgi:hypothetical protein
MSRISAIGGSNPASVGQRGAGGEQSDPGTSEGQDGEQKKEADPAAKGAAADQRDRMEKRRSTAPIPNIQASGSAGLPMEPGGEPSAAQQIAGVRARLDEAESAFRFMGTGHPDYVATKRQIEQLQAMLGALEHA